jgi:hypothetical protein
MSTPAPDTKAPAPAAPLPVRIKQILLPYTAPYYLAIVGALGAATVGFVVVIVLLILVAANFNVLGLVE